jgi:hypothetical protein
MAEKETNFDLKLNREQMDGLAHSGRGLMDYARQHDPQFKTAKAAANLHWERYLVTALIEAVHIAKGQKTRTARKRHQILKDVAAFLGHYPTDADVREALSSSGQPNESLVKAICEDVRRLKVQPPPKPRRSSLEVLEERVRKLSGKSVKQPRKRR